MNVRQLEAFKAVFVSGSVSLAADQLGVTQPAVSSLISNLEESIGFQLFERINGRLVASPEADNLFGDVETVFASLDRVSHTIEEIQTMSAGHMRFASLPGSTIKMIPQIMTPFLKNRPDINIVLHTRSSAVIKDWVAMGLVDLGLAEMPINSKAIKWEQLRQQCVCILPTGHRLVEKEVITPLDLAEEHLITLYDDHMVTRQLKKAFLDARLTLKTRLEVYLFPTCCNFVHEGAGIALVDPISAAHYADQNIVVKPFEPAIYFDIALLFPAHRPRSKMTLEFAKMLRDWFSEYEYDPK